MYPTRKTNIVVWNKCVIHFVTILQKMQAVFQCFSQHTPTWILADCTWNEYLDHHREISQGRWIHSSSCKLNKFDVPYYTITHLILHLFSLWNRVFNCLRQEKITLVFFLCFDHVRPIYLRSDEIEWCLVPAHGPMINDIWGITPDDITFLWKKQHSFIKLLVASWDTDGYKFYHLVSVILLISWG